VVGAVSIQPIVGAMLGHEPFYVVERSVVGHGGYVLTFVLATVITESEGAPEEAHGAG
jgi:hypothetical protein